MDLSYEAFMTLRKISNFVNSFAMMLTLVINTFSTVFLVLYLSMPSYSCSSTPTLIVKAYSTFLKVCALEIDHY